MKPEVKKFSRGQPCTKYDIIKCFYDHGFKDVQVDIAHSLIGIFSPREMQRAGRLERISGPVEDVYRLTEDGRIWLLKFMKQKKMEL